jgi:uncharacterized protein (DUF2141 family)
MKLLLFSFLIGFVDQMLMPQNLTVRIENIKDDQGQVAVALFNNASDFPKKRFQGKVTPAKKGEVEVVFENLPAGDYAISILHDANKDGKMNTNFMGIPKEGYGFSNNVMGTMGPPSFEKAKFKLSTEKVVIRMKY